MINILLILCGIFYAVLCVFSIVTGLMYASGKKEMNPLELSDRFTDTCCQIQIFPSIEIIAWIFRKNMTS